MIVNEAAIYDGHVSEYDFQVYQSYQHPSEDAIPQGISGYDPEEKDMQGVFMARGPGAFVTPLTLLSAYCLCTFGLWKLEVKKNCPSIPSLVLIF